MRKQDYLIKLGAGASVPQTAASVVVAANIRKTPYFDFCGISPAEKLGFGGFLDESGNFRPFAFSCSIATLVTLASNLENHYSKTVGASYGQLSMSLYLAAAARFAKSPDLDTALWATEWLGRIVHEGASLGGYKAPTAIYHTGLGSAARPSAVLAVYDELVDGVVTQQLKWFGNMKFAEDAAPAYAELLTGAEALVVCVKASLKEVITVAQAEWLITIKRCLNCQSDIEGRKTKQRPYAGQALFAGTLNEFAALAGMLRRSSKGIQVSEHAVKEDTFTADDTLLVDHVTEAIMEKFLGAGTVIAKTAKVAKNIHSRLAAVRRMVEEETHD